MRVIALRTTKQFIASKPEYQDAREPALAWHQHALNAAWESPNDIKREIASASILKDGRVVFLLVAGFEVQDCWPAHGQGQLHGFTHDAASDEKFCAEMVALS